MTPELTISGWVFIPITVVIFFLKPHWLLPIAIISSAFVPMSVVNFSGGSFELGLSLWYWLGILISIREIFFLLTGHGRYSIYSISPLFLFTTYVILTAIAFPIIFSGLPVYVPRNGLDGGLENQSPLTWSASNLGQIGYLAINCLIVLAAHRRRYSLDGSIKCLFFVFLLFLIYQVLAISLDIYYPTEILLSNPVYYFGAEQKLDGSIPRISGTFNEPSNAGIFLSAFLAAYVSQRKWILATCCSIGMILTTSSVAYFMLAAIWFGFSITSSIKNFKQGRFSLLMILQIIVLFCAFFATSVYLESTIKIVVFEKSESGSFISRIASDARALEIFVETYGLGVGLGGNRPSSFLTYCLSNIGIVGTFLFCRMVYRFIKISRNNSTPTLLVIALITSKILGGPDLNDPVLWGFIAALASRTKPSVKISHQSQNDVIANYGSLNNLNLLINSTK